MKTKKILNTTKKFLEKFWFLLWKDNSLKGWLISIIFLFVLIKFILFPGLSLITGTALPLAIVESCSMYHEGDFLSNFNNWWEKQETKYSQFNLEKNGFENFIFKKGFNKGDILFIIEAKPEKLKIGDVIIFNADKKNPIIHRIIKIENQDGEYIFSTIGDNNNGQLSLEKNIKEDQLVGKAIFKIAPLIGWAKLIFYENLRPTSERGLCEQN
ncbi:signal peptidase I [Candidatus Pacearchaeota archaeon]|nr:signal peptidase I [Candidatus Pacearchaeota archaeon]